MHGVGAATVVASLSDSEALVAMVQTAVSLPSVLLALVAGAVADLVDRRRLLLATQAWMLAATAILAAMTFGDLVTPVLALVFTFAVGAGVAASLPAYQSLLPFLLDRSQIHAGVALNGIAINLARAVGPAFAGAVIAALGAGALFVVEAVAVLGILSRVVRLESPPKRDAGAREGLAGAVAAGLQFARRSPAIRAVLIRVVLFVAGGSAFWALLPVIAFGPLHFGSRGLGLLVGAAGMGALAGAFLLPKAAQGSLDRLVAFGCAGLSASLFALALLDAPAVAACACVVAGVAWLAVLTSLNTAAQIAAPDWVRGRTLAVFQFFFQGGLALGSLVWGVVAETAGLRTGLFVPALVLIGGLVLAPRWPLVQDAHPEFWPEEAEAAR
jgi:MFS family permease